MNPESVPPFVLWIVGIISFIAAAGLLLKWFVRTIKAEWGRNGQSPTANKSAAEALDVKRLRDGLRTLQDSVDGAKHRDEKVIHALGEVVSELRGMRHDIAENEGHLRVLLERIPPGHHSHG